LFRCGKQRRRASRDLERQRSAQLDLSQQHIERIAGLQAKAVQNLFGLLQPRSGNAGSKESSGFGGHGETCRSGWIRQSRKTSPPGEAACFFQDFLCHWRPLLSAACMMVGIILQSVNSVKGR
jgi:hypothetical protein